MKKIIKKIKFIIKTILYQVKYIHYKNRCKKNRTKEFIIFNTPLHGNIGDHAIILAELELMDTLGIEVFEIPTYEEKCIFKFLSKNISKNAVILITGGGLIGSQWLEEERLVNKVIDTFYNNKIIIFPSTFYFKDDAQGREELEKSKKVINKAKDITIFAREEKTFEFLSEKYNNANIYLVPDIVFSLERTFNVERKNILLCLRSDVEGNLKQDDKNKIEKFIPSEENILKTDTVVNYAIPRRKTQKEIDNKLLEFASSKLVITDRLHGMIFAIITNTPCIVLGNYNYKVKGVYEKWVKGNINNVIFIENINDIEASIFKFINKFNENRFKYDFEKIIDVLKESKNNG